MRPLQTAVALLTLAAFAPADEPKTPPTKKADPPAEKKEEKKQPFTSKEGKFSVVFPAEGKIVEQTAKHKSEKGDRTQYQFILDKGATAFLTMYVDVADGADEVDADTSLDGGVGGLLKALKGKEVSTTKIKVQGAKGRDTVFEMPESKYYGKSRLVMVGARLHQVLVISEDKTMPGADEFIRSLTLTDLPKEKKDDK